jgi:YegS/Rv2252/BmrU family lipid kinase
MKKMLFVYNPRSGKGLIRNQLSAIIEIFSENEYDVTVYPTRMEMDGCNVVCQRAGEFDLIVCSGGDGTLDEVVMGMMNSGVRKTLGYIPAGSTNDFGSSLGIPKNMVSAAEIIVNGRPFACDIGKFNEDYFVYVAAFGFMTDVSYQTNQEMKNLLGHTAYIMEGVKRLGDWKSYRMKIESEEFSDEGDFIYGMVSNSTSVGGFKGLPGKNIELDDGLFEVMLVRTPRTLLDWQEVISGVLLQEPKNSTVVRFKTSRLVVSCEEPVAWTRDGENGGEHTEVELTNLQEEIEIMAQWEDIVYTDEAPS